MENELPPVVREFQAAHAAGDIDALMRTFAPDAVVTDEGATHVGTDEIREWRTKVASKYRYTTETTGVRADGPGRWVVAITLRGDFPGGVAHLAQSFTVRGGSIAELRFG